MTPAARASGRFFTIAPIRGQIFDGLSARKDLRGSALRIAGSSVMPARTLIAVPIASTGPIQRVAL